MDGSQYQDLAMRTNDGKSTERIQELISEGYDIGGAVNGALGLSGEAGETLDMIKKWIFHEQRLDIEHLKKEIGDVMWYVAMLCEAFEFDLNDIMTMNIDKLKARYPEGFDTKRSNNRAANDV